MLASRVVTHVLLGARDQNAAPPRGKNVMSQQNTNILNVIYTLCLKKPDPCYIFK